MTLMKMSQYPKIEPQNGAQNGAQIQYEKTWETELGKSFRTAEDLCAAGLLREDELPEMRSLLRKYKLLLPRYYASLIDRANPSCPIRKQSIPSLEELRSQETRRADPLEDLQHQPAPRITHRYSNRALLHLTPNCSMYCRYCFRKTLLNEWSESLFRGAVGEAVDYLAKHPEIEEVIFSGGDPFLCSDANLRSVLDRLAEIPHLGRVRFHTRVPVTFPMRVTPELAAAITATRFPVVVVTHFNHPKEVTARAASACANLKDRGVTILNQSVLLSGVNDDAAVLSELIRMLFDKSILPYYLHHPDRAEGTGHFDLSMEKGMEIHEKLRADLPGYLVPRYVIDVVGMPYKQNVGEYWNAATTTSFSSRSLY